MNVTTDAIFKCAGALLFLALAFLVVAIARDIWRER
jgi:hypothetical protein